MTTTTTNRSIQDVEKLLGSAVEMRGLIKRVRELSPNLADSFETTWGEIMQADQRILARYTAAKLALAGECDQAVNRIINTEGAKAIRKMVDGTVPMPKSVSEAMDALGINF